MPDADILFLQALTGLHPGSGTSLGVVDLPVQRERHTEWPMIQASSLKGVLRSACHERLAEPDHLAAFGPETSNASDFAGALSVTDARLLAFPVRSLRGVFAWATCPAALARLERDARLLAGQSTVEPPENVARGAALCFADSDLRVDASDGGRASIVLEEFEYGATNGTSAVPGWLADHAIADPGTADALRRKLVVLHDDDFTWFVRHATEVVARVGLDYETKTVKRGALFYEEFLPPETLFYSVVLATASRSDAADHDAGGMLALLREATPEVLQIGADETIGKGLTAARFLSRGREETA